MSHLRRSLVLLSLAAATIGAPSAAAAVVATSPTPTSPVVDRTPGIQAISPNHGPAAGGDTVRIGTRSVSGAILFGGKPAVITTTAVGDDFQNGIAYYYYTVVVPAGTAGTTVKVTVGNAGGVTATSNDYTYDAGAYDPTEVQCGSTFDIDYPLINVAAPGVTIGGKAATFKQVGTVLRVDAPSYAAGPTYPVSVDGGNSGTFRSGCYSPGTGFFGTVKTPGIRTLFTDRGPVTGGNVVVAQVYGDVPADAQVYFGDTPGTDTAVSPNRVFCIPEAPSCPGGSEGWLVSSRAPASAAGVTNVTVRYGTTVLRGQTAAADDYSFVAAPAIKSVTPSNGPVSGGNEILVQLSGDFINQPAVTIGGAAVQSVSGGLSTDVTDGSYGSQLIRFTVPAGPPAGGAAPLVITGASALNPSTAYTAEGVYTYDGGTPVRVPVIKSVAGSGIANAGGLILIEGTNLSGLKAVRVGSRTVTTLVKNSTLIFGFVPGLAKGSYPVTVVTRTGTTTAAARYTVR